MANLKEVKSELHRANPELSKIPQIIIINKIDLIDDQKRLNIIENFLKNEELNYCFISALKRMRLEEMLNLLVNEINKLNLAAHHEEKKLQSNQV